jgi:Lrp/AsnC family transcriptional regulator, regulator for asnA, asnC and gidA
VFDEIDHQIVEILGRDGRRTFTSVAGQLEVSEATVRGRVTKLVESEALRIVALCNPLTLGHQSIRLFITVRNHTTRSAADALTVMPLVNHVALCTGASDIYVEATCRDLDQIQQLLDDVRRIPGVATVNLHMLTKLYKDYSWVGLSGGTGQNSSQT